MIRFRMISVVRGAARASVSGAALCLVPTAVAAAQQQQPAAPAVAGEPDDVVMLATAIRKELDTLPCSAKPEALEAAMVFTLSQANAQPNLAHRALRLVELQRSCFGGQGKAITRVRTALLVGKANRGTAALTRSSGF